ncbi:hypothetical protein N9R54_01115 [Pelobium sp.]|nr:hypothetical protein [Pelobium sp.]MDA9554809.1 hypothetical protein [Pelobium sp.]
MLKTIAKTFLCFTLTLSMLSAAIPLHSIVHQHYFVKQDNCGLNNCKKHLKNYTAPCCTHSDAVFVASLPPHQPPILLIEKVVELLSFDVVQNEFQFFHLTKNKAPPVLA